MEIKALFKFIWLALRPISKTESAYGWWEIMNILPPIAYVVIPKITNWARDIDFVWFALIPAILLLIAGVKLQMRLIPRLELVYKPEAPFKIVEDPYLNPQNQKQQPERISYRVGVKLHGGKSLQGVKVQLLQSRPDIGYTPVDLKRWQSQYDEPSTFTVNPSKKPSIFVEVARYPYYTPEVQANEILLCYHVNNIPNHISSQRYVFILQLQGQDIQAQNYDFVLDIDKDDKLVFYPALTKSLYSRLSALISFNSVSLNRYGFSRLLNRHSNSSR